MERKGLALIYSSLINLKNFNDGQDRKMRWYF